MSAASRHTCPAEIDVAALQQTGSDGEAGSIESFELPPLQVRIRYLEYGDLTALEWHGGPDLRSFYQSQWRFHQERVLSAMVADLNGYAIGQLALHWSGKPNHPNIPDVQSLRVHPAFRGLCVGTRLIQSAERLTAAAGYSSISLSVGIDNDAARRLYERLGYAVVGQPYEDTWHYLNQAGEEVHIAEWVIDMLKPLPA